VEHAHAQARAAAAASAPAEPPDGLDSHAGAPPSKPLQTPGQGAIVGETTLAEAVRGAFASGLAMFERNLPGAVAGEADAIHQMRVAARRLRARIDLLHIAIHGARARSLHNDLQWLGRSAGAVREVDVIADLLRERAGAIDPSLSEAAQPLLDALVQSRLAAHRKFLQDAASPRYRRMCQRLATPLLRVAANDTCVAEVAPAMLKPMVRKARKAARRVRADSAPEQIHRLRIRFKRVRYALEILQEIGGRRTHRALGRLEELQELLGRHQDTVAAIGFLRAFANESGVAGFPPAALIAAGSLIHDLALQRRKIAERVAKRARQMARKEILKDALREIVRMARAARRKRSAAALAVAEASGADARAAPAADDVVRNSIGAVRSAEIGADPANQNSASTTKRTDESA
jgi:CHAD domain-containing protein